jgi:DNA helicase-2/ATP-dependent DNA helicase PcrA
MILRRVTSLDWSVLDLFYRLCGFSHFTEMFDQAEQGIDEGPICNLGLVSQYLARFTDEYLTVIYADRLVGDSFVHLFFSSFLYALFRRGESEYEDADDPFPKGRIPFITIHQSKGLEFPVVVLGNPRKDKKGPQKVEVLVNPLIDRESEPLDQMETFDTMRLFYVALSRAKNLLVIPHYKGQGNRINEPFKEMLTRSFPRIPDFDMSTLPAAKLETNDLPHVYSYTADYLLYKRCPRQYMIFRKYGFVPSRSQTMMFGNLVHRTLEDLHQHLIALRSQQ